MTRLKWLPNGNDLAVYPEHFDLQRLSRSFICLQGWDPDLVKKCTYFIKQGPFDKFNIDSSTGEIRTKAGLDFEETKQHILIIGLEENLSENIGATTTVIINVKDKNDVRKNYYFKNKKLAYAYADTFRWLRNLLLYLHQLGLRIQPL